MFFFDRFTRKSPCFFILFALTYLVISDCALRADEPTKPEDVGAIERLLNDASGAAAAVTYDFEKAMSDEITALTTANQALLEGIKGQALDVKRENLNKALQNAKRIAEIQRLMKGLMLEKAELNRPKGQHPLTAAPDGKATARSEKVHVIIAANTRQKTASGRPNAMWEAAQANATMMKKLLDNQLSKADGANQLTEHYGSDFDHQQIMCTINDLQVSKSGNDTIFVYFACQAGPDQNSLLVPNSGHNDGLIARSTYLDAMRRKTCRQYVLVTDTFGSKQEAHFRSNANDLVTSGDGQKPTHLLGALLLHQRGVYDFGGSRPPVANGDAGEVCVWHHDGGLFTHAFFNSSVYCQDTREGWNSLFQDLSNRMPKGLVTFQGGMTQQGQHPHVFSAR